MADFKQFDITRQTPAFDIGAQKRAGEEYLGKYGEAISGLRSPAMITEEFQKRYGVPQLRTQVQQLGEIGEMLGAQVRGMPGQIAGTTRESLVTEGQRAGMVQAQQRPILEQLGDVSRGLATAQPALTAAEQQASQLSGLEISRQELSLLPFERGFSLLEQRQAREFSGYTFQNEQELTKLISNQASGVKLSMAETARLSALAVAEMNYKSHLDGIRESGSQARQTKKAPSDLSTLFSSVFG